jgi:serine/threonine protein kinase
MSDHGITAINPGSVFAGDFRVLRLLSQGGMGAVYEVEQLSTGKPRALKLMLPQLVADAALRQRFEQEARIASRIESEHVVEVVGAGVDPATGMPWLAMELLRGQDLAGVVASRRALVPGDVVAIFEQLAHALGAAHAVGIVHRDLKPQNLFLAEARRAGSAFTLKVLDFGIAKLTQEATSTSTQAMGSPMWMAPEQSQRSAVTPATDIWALGLVAFYLLTGAFYWKAGQSNEATVMELMREILFDPLPPASARAAELRVTLPPGFDAWFARCVVRDPRARFPNAVVAFTELRASLAGGHQSTSGTIAAEPARVATVVHVPNTLPNTVPNPVPLAPTVAASNTGLAGSYTVAGTSGSGYRGPQPTALAPRRANNTVLVALLVALPVVALIAGGAILMVFMTSKPEVSSLPSPAAPGTPAPKATVDPSLAGGPTVVSPDDLGGGPGKGDLGPLAPLPGTSATPPHAARPAPPPAAGNPFVGTWDCVDSLTATFTYPLGTPVYHAKNQVVASVVDNGDHTITITNSSGGESCIIKATVSGTTATAPQGQVCRSRDGSSQTLVSGEMTVSGGKATSRGQSTFVKFVQQGFQSVPFQGNATSTSSCTRR